MKESLFIGVTEVAEILGVSKSYAYKLVHELNGDLKEKGCITIQGRTDRKYFFERIYGTRTGKEEFHGRV